MFTRADKSSRKKGDLTIWTCIAFLAIAACGDDYGFVMSPFDGDRAYQYLIEQCNFGPRVPGTPAHRACLRYLTAELQSFGARVSHQTFSRRLPHSNQSVTMTNIIASFGLKKGERALLCAHWDTRPWADQDPQVEQNDTPIIGANDGASGVAVLMEVARQIQRATPRYGVDIIFFDAEDAGLPGQPESFALGSRYFSQNRGVGYRPQFGILLDMVGDKDLQIYQEEHSLEYAPAVVEKVWTRAKNLKLPSFIPTPRYQVTDDHLPLLRAGIPCIDIIDFDYAYWHTAADTPDKCSPKSLAEVGQLVLSLIYEE